MKYTKRLFQRLFDYKKLIFLTVFFNILTVIFTLLSTYALIPVLSIIFGEDTKVYQKPILGNEGIFGLKDYLSELYNYHITSLLQELSLGKVLLIVCIFGFLMFVFKNVSRYLGGLFLSYINLRIENGLRKSIHDKILALPVSFFSDKRKGDILSRVTSDVTEIQWSIFSSLSRAVQDPLMIIGILISLIFISPQLTIFIIILLPLTAFSITRIGKSLKIPSEKARKKLGHLLSLVEEDLSGMKVIKSYTAEKHSQERFGKVNDEYLKQMEKITRRRELASPLSEMIGSAIIIAIIGYAGVIILEKNALSPAVFITYVALFYQILQPSKNIALAIADIKRGEAAAERIFEVIDAKETIVDKKSSKAKADLENDIIFENVSFSYPDSDNKYAVKDFNLTIKKGQNIALVGQSGSGKSTITNLICRFYDIEKGSILIDGEDIKNYKSKDVRKLSALVTQDSMLFNASIKENLKLANPQASDEQILKAIETANAKEFIDKLPEGLDTNIGDSGNKLSGGQKQRLCIARAVLKNAPILLLDEATSALDTESEKLVQEALEKIMQNTTSIVVAHRLSTIQKADLIVVMQNGQIIETGTHKELLEKKSFYYRLIQMQSFS